MSSQLKGGSYEINPQGGIDLKASTSPRSRDAAVKAEAKPAQSKSGNNKPTSTRKGQTA